MTTRLTMRYGADGGGIGRGTSVNGPRGGGREVDGAADGMRWIGCQRGVAGGSWKTKSTGGRDDMDGRTGACSAWNGLDGVHHSGGRLSRPPGRAAAAKALGALDPL